MATIKNKKKEPLTIAEARLRFPDAGIMIHACDSGVCLFSCSGSNDQYWVDCSEFSPADLELRSGNYDESWSRRRARLTAEISEKIFGIMHIILH